MKKITRKEDLIIQQTISILRKEGSAGLTLRKVASSLGISLSNLQYYFPGKTSLLQATVRKFFCDCEENIIHEYEQVYARKPDSSKEFLRRVLDILIINNPNDPDNIIFREMSALSVHDPVLASAFDEYYRNYVHWMIDLIKDIFPDADKIVYLIIPYSEGYNLMGESLPVDKEWIVDMIYNIVINL